VDTVHVQQGAKPRAVDDSRLEQQPRALPSSRAACLKGQRYQVFGIDHANSDPFVVGKNLGGLWDSSRAVRFGSSFSAARSRRFSGRERTLRDTATSSIGCALSSS